MSQMTREEMVVALLVNVLRQNSHRKDAYKIVYEEKERLEKKSTLELQNMLLINCF